MDVLIKCSTSSLSTHSGLTARLRKGPHPHSVTGSPAIMVVLHYETDSGTEEASLESSTTDKISLPN